MVKIYTRSALMLGLLTLVACAGKQNMTGKAPAAASKSGAVDTQKSSEAGGGLEAKVEAPVWTVGNTPMPLSCEPPASLGFKLSEGLSESNRYMLARFAMLGPAPLKFENAFLESFFKNAGFAKVTTFESRDKGVQGFVASAAQLNVVVFRGTHSVSGVATDLNFFMSGSSFANMPGGVHGGFKSAYDTVQATINSALGEQNRSKNPTYYVGHSLGGALAMLAATDGLAKNVNVAGLITLGQPRTGNVNYALNFSSALREKYFRYVHGNDPVPHLPPSPGSTETVASALTSNTLLKLGVQASALLRFGHVGVPLQLGQAQYAAQAYSSDDAWDKSYWANNGDAMKSTVTSVLSNPAANPASLMQSGLIGEHSVEKYLCEMLKSVK